MFSYKFETEDEICYTHSQNIVNFHNFQNHDLVSYNIHTIDSCAKDFSWKERFRNTRYLQHDKLGNHKYR